MFSAMAFPLRDYHPIFEQWFCASHPHQTGRKGKGTTSHPLSRRGVCHQKSRFPLYVDFSLFISSQYLQCSDSSSRKAGGKIRFPRLFGKRTVEGEVTNDCGSINPQHLPQALPSFSASCESLSHGIHTYAGSLCSLTS